MTDTTFFLLSAAALTAIAIGCGTIAYGEWKKDVRLSCFTNQYGVRGCDEIPNRKAHQ